MLGGGGEPAAPAEHAVAAQLRAYAVLERAIGREGGAVVGDGLGGEEPLDDVGFASHPDGEVELPEQVLQAIAEPVAVGAQVIVDAGLAEALDGGYAGGRGHGVPVEAAEGEDALVVGRRGVEVAHELAASRDCADGVAGAEALAEGGDVRGHAVVLLCAAEGEPEARADLVEDEGHAGLGGEIPDVLQEAGAGGESTHDGLDDDARQVGEVVRDDLAGGVDVVPGGYEDVADMAGGDARGVRVGVRVVGPHFGAAVVGAEEDPVGEPVVRPFELEDPVPAGVGPDDTEGQHDRLGAGVDEADPVGAWDVLDDHLG